MDDNHVAVDATEIGNDGAVTFTVQEVADLAGKAKRTALRHLARLKDEQGIEVGTVDGDERGTQALTFPVAAALAQSMGTTLTVDAKTKPRRAKPDAAERLTTLYEDRISSLEREVERLIDQLEKKDAAALEVGEQAQARIDELKEQVDRLDRENAKLRNDLALSRSLEGFHWPWQKDKIKAKYLLPPSSVEPQAENQQKPR